MCWSLKEYLEKIFFGLGVRFAWVRYLLFTNLSKHTGLDVIMHITSLWETGVIYFARVTEFTPKRFNLMFDVQVEASFHLAQLVIPSLRAKGQGWILNISSVAARQPTFPPTERAKRGGTVYARTSGAYAHVGGRADHDEAASPERRSLIRPRWVGAAEREADRGGLGRAGDVDALPALQGVPADDEADDLAGAFCHDRPLRCWTGARAPRRWRA